MKYIIIIYKKRDAYKKLQKEKTVEEKTDSQKSYLQ